MIDYIWMLHLALLCSLSPVIFFGIAELVFARFINFSKFWVLFIVSISTGLASFITDSILIYLFIK